MKYYIWFVVCVAGLLLSSGCASHKATLGSHPGDTVAVQFKDGHETAFRADTVTKVVFRPRPDTVAAAREYVLVDVSGEAAGQLIDTAQVQNVRIDRSVIGSEEWARMIERVQGTQRLRMGHGQLTLMRVRLEAGGPEDVIQLSSIKLTDVLKANSGGGGMYSQIAPGDFILVEHISSSRRRMGKDPVEIGGFTHQRATLWIEAPPPGQLGVLGDVVLQACPEPSMGRIVASVAGENGQPLNVRVFRLGPLVVGGPYGQSRQFGIDRTCDSGLIAPGSYKILLPDFGVVKSRWTVNVAPGMVTQLRFEARSQGQLDKVEESVTPASDWGKPVN